MNSLDNERYSICIVHADNYGEKSYYKYYRVADFIPQDNPNELVPALVQKHTTSLEEAWANPDHLYNPCAAHRHESRESDFYLFQWRQDLHEPGKQLTRSFYDDPSLLRFKEAREVIILDGDGGERALRFALSEGIPFDGKTTSVFYIVYGNENGIRPAIRCERRDFSFEDGKVRLRHAITNTKETVLSAPRVWLKDYDIIESPHDQTSFRKVYAKLEEPESDGSVLLRSIDYYASDYVKWFMRVESIQASKADRRAVSQIIDAAFSRPDALEAYLEAGAQEEEVESLKKSIARTVMEKDDQEREIFRRALLEDEGFYRECVEQVRLSDVMLEARKNTLVGVENDIKSAENTLQVLNSNIDSLNEKRQSLKAELAIISSDLERTRKEQDEVLGALESNAALKLGIKAAVSQLQTKPASNLVIEEGHSYGCAEVDAGFKDVLLNNMKRLGLTSVIGVSVEERNLLAMGLIAGMAATRFLAIPQVIARQIADSIGIAISGCSAKRVLVPADFRDISSVLSSVSFEDGVVLVEGIIDSINESVLFSLLSEDVRPIVVLSFASHASAALVAKEAWGRVFLPNVESLLVFSGAAKTDKLQHTTSPLELPKVSVDDALSGVRDLEDELGSLHLTAEQLLLSATVLRAVEELTDEDSIEHVISQHLLMSSLCGDKAFAIVENWSGKDRGLTELAKKLGVYES